MIEVKHQHMLHLIIQKQRIKKKGRERYEKKRKRNYISSISNNNSNFIDFSMTVDIKGRVDRTDTYTDEGRLFVKVLD